MVNRGEVIFAFGMALLCFLSVGGGLATGIGLGRLLERLTAVEKSGPDLGRGKSLFTQNCGTCHGPEARGVPHLGKDLVTSKFTMDLSDDQLLAFVRKGRAANDSSNTTGIPMPPSGGNPSLSDDQLREIIAYLRTLKN
jgi:mono/diheme cytochrome c family protein